MGTLVYMKTTDTITRIRTRAAAVKADALTIDASHTEAISPADLRVGDVITQIDAHIFPFPFTLSQANTINAAPGVQVVQVHATHGWFAHLNSRNVVRRVIH